MADIKSMIIIEKHYLLQAGTEALILDIPGIMHVKSYSGDEPHLTDIILKYKPDLLIINPFSLSAENAALPRKIYSKQNTYLIAMIRKEEKGRLSFDYSEILYYEDSKYVLEKKLRNKVGSQKDEEPDHKELSPRELTILKQVVLGLTHQEIADKLFLSVHTVNTHRKHINKKLGIKTVSGLSVYAIMNHIVKMEELANNAR